MTQTIAEIVGPGHVYNTVSSTESYSVDGVVPAMVLFPGDREEARQILFTASESGKRSIPWGNGTKMGWGNIPFKIDWVVCTRRLDRITDPDYENLTVTAEAGTRLSKIQDLLKGLGRGYFLPLDPPFSQTATLGGIVAGNSSGPKRRIYGTARDLILAMKVALPDGTQNTWGGKTVKNVAGYDMPKLYVGSFGTLGLITEVTLRILPLPEKESTLTALFGDAREAFKAVSEILQSRLLPSAVEIMDNRTAQALGLPFPGGDSGALLAVNFEGFCEAVERQIRQLREMLEIFQVSAVDLLEDTTQERFWTGLRDLESTPPFTSSGRVSYKVSLPVSKTAEVFHLLKETSRRMELDGALRCHAGNGIVEGEILLNEDPHRKNEWLKALSEVRARVRAFEGLMVIKAAPVAVKREIDVWGAPGKEFRLMEAVKNRFDPRRLLNPGRFVGGI
jgi:glycolate oxidase FAD binding subunit